MPYSPTAEWFSTWFDSPYYHVLYQDRNHAEARAFLDKLLLHLHPKPTTRLLDLACGKGRHAVYLSERGYDVTGVDLSPRSIRLAQQHAHEHLRFYVHDMREPLPYGPFDFIFNLFTSFGYFEQEAENVVALRNAAAALQPGGKMVIDFLNTTRVIQSLVAHETKVVDGTEFRLRRHFHHGFIVKEIRFHDAHGEEHAYEERVRAISRARFEEYFQMAGLRLCEVLGDYHLAPFDEARSPRMIFVLKK
ncbi:class I SAM-dependent methyltransferase [Hymenobacter weizhouensis]|uniref:class I SAM-dependent methyltransferase n=1 Tax=Hymenobacter sp. YIM 151500-1 TaxID=2987689 RepID=UPI002226E922|nr:class I SAM-dependent methyltransferase [Hymenobacter sp. YIM 151500-1]UYZ62415.1 methyltransferase domain-containing protein [Hymenobacter sp. YIM 151500-1]